MALLIAMELLTLIFAMKTLSSVRAFVEGEGLWSKSQKDAMHSLYQYALTGEEERYEEFQKYLEIPMGDRMARLEMMKPEHDREIIRQGFLQGGNHSSDIDGMIDLLLRFNQISYIHEAISAWTQADLALDELLVVAEKLRFSIRTESRNSPKVAEYLKQISEINTRLTVLETAFSSSLGAGSRWLEQILMTVLALTVLTIEGTGLLLTFKFSQNLNRSLRELMETAKQVGRGNFSLKVPVHSKDELGQLAEALNEMIEELRTSIGERKQAESASQIKSIFLANMSHEIRTPLGVILGFVDVLKEHRLSREEEMKYLGIIEQTGKNLSRIINDILDISKVESGHLEPEIQAFGIDDLFGELMILFQMKAQQGNNKIVFKVDENAPLEIATDRLRLQQILMNLLSNALRFTESGQIIVRYKSEGSRLLFSITDTGIGLNPEQVKKLFGLFSQADQSTTRKYGGTDLGLVLSQKLARALGGDIELTRTAPGEGSTFLVTIQNEIEKISPDDVIRNAANVASFDPQQLKDARVLVVDDSLDNQLLLKVLLAKHGVIVDTADNGEQGATKAMKGNFDIVLMDIQMPVLDGYSATTRLRENGYRKPIIALTANAMKEDWKRCMAAGCNDYLTKPIEATKLMRMIGLYLPAKQKTV